MRGKIFFQLAFYIYQPSFLMHNLWNSKYQESWSDEKLSETNYAIHLNLNVK